MVYAKMSALVAALSWPVRLLSQLLDRIVAVLDAGPAAGQPGAVRLRRGLAVVTFVLALVVSVRSARSGGVVSPPAVLMLVLAVALYTNRGGRFVHDWVPAALAFFSYALVAAAVPDLGLSVHYTPQIDAERLLAFGSLPTHWLQEHLYGGATGALEVFSLLMYLSHFLAPVLLACLIWLFWPGRGFHDLLFGIIVVSFLGDLTFLLAPTAPPWLAAEHGLIAPVEPVLERGLADLGLHDLAALKGDADAYNVVAAIPSLHAAWPVIALLVIRKHGLPRWLFWAQAVVTVGVLFAIVYTGEHYLVDALVGAVYALAAWWIVQRALGAASVRAPALARPNELAARLPTLPQPAPTVTPAVEATAEPERVL
jgi:hypothetical protein